MTLENGLYTAVIHAMAADEIWKAWKAQLLNVGQVATWQQRHNHYFSISKGDQN
jgi:hypothetical protein